MICILNFGGMLNFELCFCKIH